MARSGASLYYWLRFALVACLVGSLLSVPAVWADGQVDEFDEEAEVLSGSASGGLYEDDAKNEIIETTPEHQPREEEEEEEIRLQPAPGVTTVAIFPGSQGKTATVRAGQQAEILFGINNEASTSLQISGILARLYVPYDYKIVAQNFTGELPSNATLINATVPRGVQSSFSFHFTPFQLLQPMTFALAATLFYELDGNPHASVLYNSTLELIEPAGMVSGETIFLVLLGAGVLALLGMWASSQLENLSKRAKRSKKVETGTGEDASANNEWLQGTFFNPKQGQAVKQRRRR